MTHTRNRLWILVLILVLLTGCSASASNSLLTDNPETAAEPASVVQIEAGETSPYVIVVPNRSTSELQNLAASLQKSLKRFADVQIDIVKDSDAEERDEEILIGKTNREASRTALAETPYGEYAFRTEGKKLILSGWDDAALKIAVARLKEVVVAESTDEGLTLTEYAQHGTAFARLGVLPVYGSIDQAVHFIELGDGSRMLYVKRSNVKTFESYLDALREAGFEECSRREIGKNIFAVFTGKDKILHASLSAANRDVRVTVDDAYDRSLFTEQPYEKVCEPAVHLLALEFPPLQSTDADYLQQNSLGLIFRLEDGRFVIVDGGDYGDKRVETFWNALCDLAVDPDNITIAAWIFTHPHADHVGTFCSFSASSHKNSVKIENFLYHFPTDAQCKVTNLTGTMKNIRNALKKFGKAAQIPLQTGMVLKIGGAEIEVLYTFADAEPTTLDNGNDSSLVLRFTLAGQTVLVPGDTTDTMCKFLVQRYGNYLKSDIVQIVHHGYNGTNDFYKAVDADVLLWPGGVRQFYGRGDLYRIKDWKQNQTALSLAKECFVAGAHGWTLELPYTPPDTKTVIIHDGEN